MPCWEGSRSSGTRSAGGKEGRDQPAGPPSGGGGAWPCPFPDLSSNLPLTSHPLPSPPTLSTFKLAHAISYKDKIKTSLSLSHVSPCSTAIYWQTLPRLNTTAE